MDVVKSIAGEWYHIPTLLTFSYMVLSPSKFFSKIDTVVLQEPDSEEEVMYTSNDTFTNGDSMEEIERDERVMNNINKMISNSPNPHIKQIWEVKKAEFERELRWKRHTYYN
jgi:hypothetical protein